MVGPLGSVAILSLEDALARLRSPFALEAFSVLTGDPVLVADLDSAAGAADEEAILATRATLAQLACPCVAVCAGTPGKVAAGLVDAFDVVVRSPAELEPIVEASHRTPLAAMALVQLLRQGGRLDAHGGLLAESLVYSTLQSGPEFANWQAGRAPRSSRRSGRPEPAVLVTRRGDRLLLTLNRPEKHNAYSAEMRDALVAGLRIAVADSSITEVVLNGTGPSFCSGGDLDEFGTLPDPATAHAVRSTRNAARLLAACGDRVRAEVHGACVGAGVELAAFAHRVVASEGAYFQLPEVAMGLVPGAGGTVSLPRRIGRQRTAYLALSGARLEAPEALRWGLVDELGGPPP